MNYGNQYQDDEEDDSPTLNNDKLSNQPIAVVAGMWVEVPTAKGNVKVPSEDIINSLLATTNAQKKQILHLQHQVKEMATNMSRLTQHIKTLQDKLR